MPLAAQARQNINTNSIEIIISERGVVVSDCPAHIAPSQNCPADAGGTAKLIPVKTTSKIKGFTNVPIKVNSPKFVLIRIFWFS